MARVNFYNDGLNLYYGMLRSRPHLKWLDLRKWCEGLTADHEVNRVHYFTALVRSLNNDDGPRNRQDRYLRALRAHGGVEVHEAFFGKEGTKSWALDWSTQVAVWKIEEKCSDVNIASHMLFDATRNDCDILALICNDSDLVTPVSMLVGPAFNKEVWVFNPTKRPRCAKFKPTIHLDAEPAGLARAQLPPVVVPAKGRQLPRPPEWI